MTLPKKRKKVLKVKAWALTVIGENRLFCPINEYVVCPSKQSAELRESKLISRGYAEVVEVEIRVVSK
jgi:hypothetical protein